MYDFATIETTLQTKLKALTDPYDASDEPKGIFENVIFGEPDLLPSFGGPLGAILFIDTDETMLGVNKRQPINAVNVQPKRQLWEATITGSLVLLVQGNDDTAALSSVHLADVISDFYKDQNALDLPGTTITPLTTGKSINWRPLTVTLEKMEKPANCMTASIKFVITANDNIKH